MDRAYDLSFRTLLQLYVLGLLFVGALWAELDAIHPLVSVGLLALVSYLSSADRGGTLDQRVRLPVVARLWARLDGPSLGIALAIALPTLLYFMLTWDQEFPWGGDHSYHLSAGLETGGSGSGRSRSRWW